jgi:hypothetical protein
MGSFWNAKRPAQPLVHRIRAMSRSDIAVRRIAREEPRAAALRKPCSTLHIKDVKYVFLKKELP